LPGPKTGTVISPNAAMTLRLLSDWFMGLMGVAGESAAKTWLR
jgi:hypothetical protein